MSFIAGNGVSAPRVAELRFGTLGQRIASALVLIPLSLVATWYGDWPFTGLVALAAAVMLAEWERMAGSGRLDWRFVLKLLILVLALFAAGQALFWVAFLAVAAAALLAAALAMAARGSPQWAAAGMVYIGVPCVVLLWLRGLPGFGLTVVVWLLVLVWATDSGAYLAGKTIGGPKLAPRVSPNKTWAGLFGGIAAAAATGVVVGLWTGSVPVLALALVSGLLAAVAQAGDLAESLVKRHFNVKDAGQIIPGHGGALDRLDGMLFAVPVAGLMLLVLQGAGQWQ